MRKLLLHALELLINIGFIGVRAGRYASRSNVVSHLG